MITEPTPVRCAIYTRKSTTEGLDSDFSTLDAQRESCESYILSQKQSGWVPLAESYDDGGYTGSNIDRPAMVRLLHDIEAHKIDCVVVYKIDRLSRSLLDFAKLVEVFDQNQVSFVSVTQQFNTGTSMGRLVQNVLLSFAQFEREMIGERTSDKMCAARRRGKYVGGPPVLAYDVDREKKRLIVNHNEAETVRGLFQLYLKKRSLLKVVTEVNRSGWKTKSWVTVKGRRRAGGRFDKAKLQRVLTNVTYSGQVAHKGSTFPGEHDAIIEPSIFKRVQAMMRRNGGYRAPANRRKHMALLQGLVRCGECGAALGHTYAKKKNTLY